jgi:predicted ATPase with chaperone activity
VAYHMYYMRYYICEEGTSSQNAARKQLHLSGRAYRRILKLSRTIAHTRDVTKAAECLSQALKVAMLTGRR